MRTRLNLLLALGAMLALPTCGDSDDPPRDLEPAAYACETAADCAIRPVPACCFDMPGTYEICLGRDATIPTSIDCSDNDTCAGVQAIDRCECGANQLFEGPDAPERVCVGRSGTGTPDGG